MSLRHSQRQSSIEVTENCGLNVKRVSIGSNRALLYTVADFIVVERNTRYRKIVVATFKSMLIEVLIVKQLL